MQSAINPVKYGRRSGWTKNEAETLRKEITVARERDEPLRAVFERVAAQTGRRPNSIRNYYYTEIHQTDGKSTFIPFDAQEMRNLLITVLRAQAQGVSVRKCTMAMGQGDRSAMLRYQNKYRSLLRTHPEMVREVIEEMRAQSIPCVDPYASMNRSVSGAQEDLPWRELAGNPSPAVQSLLAAIDMLVRESGKNGTRRKIEQYDALCARYDLLAIEYNRLEQELRESKDQQEQMRRALCQSDAELSLATRGAAIERMIALCREFTHLGVENSADQALEMADKISYVLACYDAGCAPDAVDETGYQQTFPFSRAQ